MPNIIFSEGSGLADSIYGNVQAPVRLLVERRAEAYEQLSVLPEVFVMGTSQNFGDLYTGLTEMDDFEAVGENGAYPTTSMQEGYKKLIRYETWKQRFVVSQEMVEDSKMMDLRQKPAKFVGSFYRTRERFGAAMYAAAIQGQKVMKFGAKEYDITTGDGEALFSKNHKPKVKGPAQSNVFSDKFSDDALAYGESRMQNYRDEDGNILAVAPNVILIPNDAEAKKTVFAVIGADKEPTSNNNGFNFTYGRWTVIIWSYLNQFLKKADNFPWILLDQAYNKEYNAAPWNDRVPLTVKSIIDPNTDANCWNGRARFGAGFVDWRHVLAGGITGAEALKSA